ncbi:egg cell-secreted protein 1.4-like [Phalaenopsis equestris]|uniref:egg cell-secreted protein 1.4-like n=1 Tax=Phalaenopsis equestris TaxID=78828 RepID=UPI0009E530FD|nr:egg cell-secreted protein 1.4-like [Phalaenopsis equestris]
MAAKSATMPYFILFLVFVGTTMPTASSFDLIPDILKCWKAATEVEQCVVKLIPSFLNLHINLSQDCCKAVVHIEESCLPFIFTVPVLGPGLANVTSSICGAFADPPSPPAAA